MPPPTATPPPPSCASDVTRLLSPDAAATLAAAAQIMQGLQPDAPPEPEAPLLSPSAKVMFQSSLPYMHDDKVAASPAAVSEAATQPQPITTRQGTTKSPHATKHHVIVYSRIAEQCPIV